MWHRSYSTEKISNTSADFPAKAFFPPEGVGKYS
jgi:hypothetical protein